MIEFGGLVPSSLGFHSTKKSIWPFSFLIALIMSLGSSVMRDTSSSFNLILLSLNLLGSFACKNLCKSNWQPCKCIFGSQLHCDSSKPFHFTKKYCSPSSIFISSTLSTSYSYSASCCWRFWYLRVVYSVLRFLNLRWMRLVFVLGESPPNTSSLPIALQISLHRLGGNSLGRENYYSKISFLDVHALTHAPAGLSYLAYVPLVPLKRSGK